MLEVFSPVPDRSVEVVFTRTPLEWSETDFLTEMLIAKRMATEPALPLKHRIKMEKRVAAKLGVSPSRAIDVYRAHLSDNESALGIDPEESGYQHSVSRMRKHQETAGNTSARPENLDNHSLLSPQTEHNVSHVVWCARSQLSLINPQLGHDLREGSFATTPKQAWVDAYADEPVVTELLSDYFTAIDTLVLHNQRLVMKMVSTRTSQNGVEKEDMFAAAQFGLRRAAELYDASSGNRFSTFASKQISQSVQRMIENQANMIRLPPEYHGGRIAIRDVRDQLLVSTGREPTMDEICDVLNKRKNPNAKRRGAAFTPDKIRTLMHAPVAIPKNSLDPDHEASVIDFPTSEVQALHLSALVEYINTNTARGKKPPTPIQISLLEEMVFNSRDLSPVDMIESLASHHHIDQVELKKMRRALLDRLKVIGRDSVIDILLQKKTA